MALSSVIIPTCGNRTKYLRDTVESVIKQNLSSEQYEIIIVDNSLDGRAFCIIDEYAGKFKHRIKYVHENNMGLHNARHTGARHAEGEVLVYIDDDIIAPENWLESIIKPFEDQNVGCSGGKVVPQWEAVVPQWFTQFHEGHLSLLDLGEEKKELNYPGIWGCNMAVRKKILFDLGGFHPDGIWDRKHIWLRGSGECGLEEKIYNAGFKLIYEPSAWLYHRIPASRLTPKYFYWRLFTQGIDDSYRYLRKIHKDKRSAYVLLVIKEIILSVLKALKASILLLINGKKRVYLTADVYYWYGKGQHLVRTLMSKKLRLYVLQDSYL